MVLHSRNFVRKQSARFICSGFLVHWTTDLEKDTGAILTDGRDVSVKQQRQPFKKDTHPLFVCMHGR
jgi:hypothetical protein